MGAARSIIIGTAGHIDHGKTSLVKALTGVDTDRLPEEKARGITIDLGFAHWKAGDAEVSFIDVPGHEKFVRNMLAGIGGIDLLLLVIAADESVMPQTREHFDICRLLGISAGIVVLTKKDLADEETIHIVKEDIARLVEGSFLQDAPIYAVSTRTGEGIDQLKDALIANLEKIKPRQPIGVFRLPVDRVFTLKGHGTVVTGTLIAGRLRKDQPVEILPSGKRTRARSIHAHDTNVDEAVAGQRTAVNLMSLEKDEVVRGDVLTQPDVFENTSLLDVKLTLLSDARPIPHNALVRLHVQASDLPARVTLLGKDVLLPGENAFAQLRLQRPLVAVYGDRFIIRRHSPSVTVGGGVILDHLPLKRIRRTDSAALDRLQQLEQATMEQRFSIAVAQKGIAGAGERRLQAALALDVATLRRLVAEDVVPLREQPLLCISKSGLSRIFHRLRENVESFHAKNPLLPGIPKEELRTRYFSALAPDVFSAALDRAIAENIVAAERDIISLSGRSVLLNREDEALLSAIESALQECGLQYPGMEEVAKRAGGKIDDVKKRIYLLVRQQKAVKFGDDYFLTRGTWEDLKTRIRSLKASQKTLSVGDFKDLFGISRKYAIPLLEALDREGITRRAGNERIIL